MAFKRKIPYLAKFNDSEGHEHFAIHFYDRITGFVDMMRDVKFDKLDGCHC